MKVTRYFAVSLVAVVLGVMLAVQFRTTSTPVASAPMNREQELIMEKKSLEKDLLQVREEIVDLSIKLDKAGAGENEAGEVLERELLRIKRFAGLVPVSGPGVEILIQSPPRQANLGADQTLKTILDEDLLKVVNILRTGGAEAISVNDQRLLATSEIRLAGNHININATPLSPPYHIAAIGDTAAMLSRLEIRDGHVEYLRESGVSVTVQAEEKITIPAYKGTIDFEHSKPAEKGALPDITG